MEAQGKLKPVLTAQYNRDKACLRGTYEALFDGIKSWSLCLDVLADSTAFRRRRFQKERNSNYCLSAASSKWLARWIFLL